MAMILNKALSNRALLTKISSLPTPASFVALRYITLKREKVQTGSTENFVDHNLKLGRPLSPHLSIYSFQLTSSISISHRFAGITLTAYATALGLGALVLPHDFSYYVSAIEGLQLSAATLTATKFLLAFPFAFHTCNGIRHLTWDMGKFLSIKDVYATGYIMLLASVITTGALALL